LPYFASYASERIALLGLIHFIARCDRLTRRKPPEESNMKLVFGMAAVALLLVSSTLEGTALRHFDWPNSGTCMGGPRDGKMVRDLKFCNFFGPGAKARRTRERRN
jgi:hypothetical protein